MKVDQNICEQHRAVFSDDMKRLECRYCGKRMAFITFIRTKRQRCST